MYHFRLISQHFSVLLIPKDNKSFGRWYSYEDLTPNDYLFSVRYEYDEIYSRR